MSCKLVAYLRVSTDGQARNGHGLSIQERDVRAWAKANGHKVAEVCADEGLTGTLDAQQRPGLVRALDMLRSGEATALVVPSLDRLGRTITTQEAALALAWDAGGRVYSIDQGEILQDDPDDPMRTAIRQMRGVMHQLDKALISKRLRAGRRAKREAGGFAGGTLPYGFRLEDGQLIQDAEEMVVVELVGRLAAGGASLRSIASALDEAGHRPRNGGTWHPNTIRRIAAQAPVPAARP
jgi:DNA invertase Pin-like site-specific DNA recombinase